MTMEDAMSSPVEPTARVRILDGVAVGVEALVVAAVVVNIVVTFGNSLVRYLFKQDFSWTADVWTILISIIAFPGAAAYFRRTPGMAYTALVDSSHGTQRQAIEATGLAIFLAVCLTGLLAYPSFFAG